MLSPQRRIDVVGPESTGKTTLCAALAANLPATVVPEHLRMFAQHHHRPPQRWEQLELLVAQEHAVEAALGRGDRWVVNDAGCLQTAAYHLAYFDDHSLIEVAVAASRRCRLVVRCVADFTWVADSGQRDGPRWQRRVDSALDIVLASVETEVLDVAGEPDQRIAMVNETLERPSRPA